MKKRIAMVLAAAMILNMTSVAFAYTGGSGMGPEATSSEMIVEYNPADGESYIVTIPAKVTLTGGGIDNAEDLLVEATDVRMGSTHEVEVRVASSNIWKMVDSTGTSNIEYRVMDTDDDGNLKDVVANGDVVLECAGEGVTTAKSGSKTLKVSTTDEAIAAATNLGTHVDTLTFTCAIVLVENDEDESGN